MSRSHPMDVLDDASRLALVAVVVVGIDETGAMVVLSSEQDEHSAVLAANAYSHFELSEYRNSLN